MRPTPFTVDVHPDGDRTIVTPAGELDLATVDQLAAALQRVVDGGASTIVIDLRALAFLDSTGLRLLIGQTQRGEPAVQLVDGSPPVSRLFELTGLRDVLPFVSLPDGPSTDGDARREDRTDAVGSPQSAP